MGREGEFNVFHCQPGVEILMGALPVIPPPPSISRAAGTGCCNRAVRTPQVSYCGRECQRLPVTPHSIPASNSQSINSDGGRVPGGPGGCLAIWTGAFYLVMHIAPLRRRYFYQVNLVSDSPGQRSSKFFHLPFETRKLLIQASLNVSILSPVYY